MIYYQLYNQLLALRNLLETLNTDDFIKPIVHLDNASIGAHCRHIIELLQCLLNGYVTEEVNYNNRPRNFTLETNKEIACEVIDDLLKNINRSDKALMLISEKEMPSVSTTYYRELIYNTEHVIHHLALIKVAIIELNQTTLVDKNFGVAYSTIKFRENIVFS